MTDLTAATATAAETLTGPERFIGEQDGADVVMTADQVKAFVLTGVPMVGMRLALSGAQLQTVSDAIPADVTDAVNIRWTSGARIRTGDALHTFIKTTLGLSDGDMTTLMTAAAAHD